MPSDCNVDVLIVGGGPAGLSAALVLSRARYKTAIFDSGVYRNAGASHMHMFPTWDHQDPAKYRAAARTELSARYSEVVQFVNIAVTKVTKSSDGIFFAVDSLGKVWSGKKLILASGVKSIFPNILGYENCWNKGMYVLPMLSKPASRARPTLQSNLFWVCLRDFLLVFTASSAMATKSEA